MESLDPPFTGKVGDFRTLQHYIYDATLLFAVVHFYIAPRTHIWDLSVASVASH